MRNYENEMREILERLIAVHKETQTVSTIEEARGLTVRGRELIITSSSLLREIMTASSEGNTSAQSAYSNLAELAMQSASEGRKAMQHVIRLFGAEAVFNSIDVDSSTKQ